MKKYSAFGLGIAVTGEHCYIHSRERSVFSGTENMKMDIGVRRKVLESNMSLLQKKVAELKQKDALLIARQEMLHLRFLQVMAADTRLEPKQTTNISTQVVFNHLSSASDCVGKISTDPRPEEGFVKADVTQHISSEQQVKTVRPKFARRRSLTPTLISNKENVDGYNLKKRKHFSTGALDRLSPTYESAKTHISTRVPEYVPSRGYGVHRSMENISHSQSSLCNAASGEHITFKPEHVLSDCTNTCRNGDSVDRDSPTNRYPPRWSSGYGSDFNFNPLERKDTSCDTSLQKSVFELRHLRSVPPGLRRLLSGGVKCTWC